MQLGNFNSSYPAAVPLKNRLDQWLADWGKTCWPGVLVLVLATLAAYWPVFSAGFIWDDDLHVIDNQFLRDFKGLLAIWLDPQHNPQYYPVVFSSFWLEYHVWGTNPTGYHVVNVLLQITVALLLWRALARLAVPGAWLAAALFALHPVQVESVAWITERKNLLSTLFYLAAALAYLRFAGLDSRPPADRRARLYYWLAFGLSLAALGSKTVACSLPVALGLVIWWKKGRVGRAEILPLLPFFLAGLILGLNTAWLERTHVGAQGADWSLTFLDRLLLAGRALWFYAASLAFPFRLTFIYPRWNINAGVWWQWLFPLTAAGLLATLWRVRERTGRGPLVAVLFFMITLAPALGFVNIYPMRFTFVADHFQYLASAGLIALAASRLSQCPKIVPGALLGLYALLSCSQCAIYHDLETLWRDTLAKNPACWMAHTNLGRLLAQQKKYPEAETQYLASLSIYSRDAETHYNYGNLLARAGLPEKAIEQYQAGVLWNPTMPDIHSNLGVVLLQLKRTDEAIVEDLQAVRLDPGVMRYHYNLANALAAANQTGAALAEFQRALQLEPDSEVVKRRLRTLGVVVN